MPNTDELIQKLIDDLHRFEVEVTGRLCTVEAELKALRQDVEELKEANADMREDITKNRIGLAKVVAGVTIVSTAGSLVLQWFIKLLPFMK